MQSKQQIRVLSDNIYNYCIMVKIYLKYTDIYVLANLLNWKSRILLECVLSIF